MKRTLILADLPARRGQHLIKQTDNISVHHVRTLADLNRPGQPQPPWAQVMAKIRRKALVVCGDCHDLIHGHPAFTAHAVVTGEPDTRKRVRPVRGRRRRAEKDQLRLAPRRSAEPTLTLQSDCLDELGPFDDWPQRRKRSTSSATTTTTTGPTRPSTTTLPRPGSPPFPRSAAGARPGHPRRTPLISPRPRAQHALPDEPADDTGATSAQRNPAASRDVVEEPQGELTETGSLARRPRVAAGTHRHPDREHHRGPPTDLDRARPRRAHHRGLGRHHHHPPGLRPHRRPALQDRPVPADHHPPRPGCAPQERSRPDHHRCRTPPPAAPPPARSSNSTASSTPTG